VIRAWRITHARYADRAFDGEGAYLYGGRWNNPGHKIVYVSGSLALAALELLVNGVQPHDVDQFVCLSVDFTEEIVQALDTKSLPSHWAESPAPDETRAVGDAWLAAKTSSVLQVPSAVIPDEPNFLINPLNMTPAAFKTGPVRPFSFDRRLFRLSKKRA
jgi:RES domain-containing protein